VRSRWTLAAAWAAATLTTLTGPPFATAASPKWRWPIRGEVVERFALAQNPYAPGQHRGIDIAAPRGTAVRAACTGRVRFAGHAGSFGRAITMACGGLVVSYGHLGKATAGSGAHVSAGERIGTVGTTGRGSSSGPHLHLGVRRAGEPHGYVDPLDILPAAGPDKNPPPLPLTGRRSPRPRSNPALAPPPTPTTTPIAAWAGVALLAATVPGLALAGTRRGRAATRRAAKAPRGLGCSLPPPWRST
jgi:hypothetical protein